MNSFGKMLKQSLLMSVVMLLLCSIAYPLALTGASQAIFSKQANGSLIVENGTAIGSELIGQDFTDARFFRGRVSSVNYNTYEEGDPDYGGVSSGNFNYGATNPALAERVKADMATFLAAHPGVEASQVPTDLLTASGSGLDPHISPASAKIQVAAIAQATGLTEAELNDIVDAHTEGKVLGVLGENRFNVLEANIEIAKKIGMIPA